jgi:HK97 family phage portal protein
VGLRSRISDARHARLQKRFYDWQSQVPPYPGRFTSTAGTTVSEGTAVGLPGVSSVLRLISETVGLTPIIVYRGVPPNLERARDTWQWERLHDAPNDEQSAFDFWQDATTSIEATGNVFIWKVIGRRPIQAAEDIQLYVLDPHSVYVRREGGKKLFDVRVPGTGDKQTVTSRKILHIRGWSALPGADAGISPIALHRDAIGKSIATEEYESRFFTNSATPPIALKVDGNLTQQAADEIRDSWMERYGGTQNAFRPAILKNGAEPVKLGFSLADCQFIEQKRYGLEDICRIFRLSAVGLVGASTVARPPTVAEDIHRFLQVDMGPRYRRFEMALRADADLFGADDLFPEFLPDMVLRPDIQLRFAAYKDALQAGWMTSNEVRERENLPPHVDGEMLQQTPVGGAPNISNGKSEADPASLGQLP